jgi:hypothetical protein
MGSHTTLAHHQLAAEALLGDPDGWHQGHLTAQRAAEHAFDRLNPQFGVPAEHRDPLGQQAVRDREAALALGTRVAVASSRENDRDPVIWLTGQDYRAAGAVHAARRQPVRTRQPAERASAER